MLEGHDMEELKDTNPKGIAATNRVSLSLMPDTAVIYCNLACLEGALKYGRYNWRVSGVLASTYVDAARRHIMKWYAGEETDPTTGVPHLANALACLAILVDADEHNALVDDRPPTNGVEPRLLESFQYNTRMLREKLSPRFNPKQYTIDDPIYSNPPGGADAVDRSPPHRSGDGEHSTVEAK